MTEGKGSGSPIPVNRAALEPADYVAAAARGIFAVSPPGTGRCGVRLKVYMYVCASTGENPVHGLCVGLCVLGRNFL